MWRAVTDTGGGREQGWEWSDILRGRRLENTIKIHSFQHLLRGCNVLGFVLSMAGWGSHKKDGVQAEQERYEKQDPETKGGAGKSRKQDAPVKLERAKEPEGSGREEGGWNGRMFTHPNQVGNPWSHDFVVGMQPAPRGLIDKAPVAGPLLAPQLAPFHPSPAPAASTQLVHVLEEGQGA